METLNKLTNLVYQGAIDGNWRCFLEHFMQATQSNNGWLMMLDTQSLTPHFSEYISTQEDFDHTLFLNEYTPRIAEDPFYQHSVKLKESACFRGSDIVPSDKLRTYSLYPLFERSGCEHVLASIPVRDTLLNSFTVMHRNKDKKDYSTDDVRLMKMMVPHINRAFHLHNLLLRQQQQISLYQAIIEKNPNPLLLVDEKLTLLLINDVAHRLLLKQNILFERNGKLTCKTPSCSNTLQAFVRSTLNWIQAGTPEPMSIVLNDNIDKVRLKAFPIHDDSNFNNFSNRCCIIEIVMDKQPQWALICDEFSITPKELRTIQHLYNGSDLHSLAEQSCLSFNTVKSQLMSVFRKININNQRELITMLAKYI